MLGLMRKHAKSWMINIIIGAIVIVFVFWGVGSFRNREITKAATVNGQNISYAEFQERYARLLEAVQKRYKGSLNEEVLKAMNLKAQALSEMISEYLLFQQAQVMGLRVGEEDLKQEIVRTPWFQMDGQFNPLAYRRVLATLRMTPTEYEALLRKELLIRKVTGLIGGLAKVSESEVKDMYHLARDEISLSYVVFEPKSYLDKVKPTPAEIQAYFDKNKEHYRVPARVKVAFLAFRPEDYEDKVKVTETQVKEYYQRNKASYEVPEQFKIRHILFKLSPEAAPAEKDKIKAQAKEVLIKAQDPKADFADLAKKYSQDPTAEQGGEMGWLDPKQFAEPLSKAIRGLKKGQVSDLIETSTGLYIVKLEDTKPAQTKPLEEVSESIERTLRQAEAKNKALEEAEKTYFDEISLLQDFDAAVKKLGLKPIETDFFSEDQPLDEVKGDLNFNKAALALNKGDFSQLVDLESGHYIIKCLDRKESYVPKLEEVEERVKLDLTEVQGLELAKKAAEEFLAQAKKNWDEAVKQAKLEVQTTEAFTRGANVPQIGGDLNLTEAAFSLESPEAIGPQPYKGLKGYYVIRLKEKKPASDEEFEKVKNALMSRVQQQKGQDYVQEWLAGVRSKSKIEVTEGLL